MIHTIPTYHVDMTTLALLVACCGFTPVQDSDAQKILKRYDALRPGARDLAMYRLDWAASLQEARGRAAREKRPVLLVIVHAKYGDLFPGHC